MNTNNDMNKKAAEIIANEITKLPANTPMDYGTLGAQLGNTKRESEAHNMALAFVQQFYKIQFTGALRETWTVEQKEAYKVVTEITEKAIASTGK